MELLGTASPARYTSGYRHYQRFFFLHQERQQMFFLFKFDSNIGFRSSCDNPILRVKTYSEFQLFEKTRECNSISNFNENIRVILLELLGKCFVYWQSSVGKRKKKDIWTLNFAYYPSITKDWIGSKQTLLCIIQSNAKKNFFPNCAELPFSQE